MNVYREPAPTEPAVEIPAEYVYHATHRGGALPGFAIYWLFTIPLGITGILAVVASPIVALLGFIVSAAVVFMLWPRRGRTTSFHLRVEQGELVVHRGATEKEDARFTLNDLLNVTLDTKTEHMVQESGSAIPAMRFVEAKAGLEVDKARLVLIGQHRGPLGVGKTYHLGEAYLPHMDATESLGKIRVFLRKNGWVPEDERDAAAQDD